MVHTSPIRPEVNTSQKKYIPSRSYSCVWLVLIREGLNKQEGSTYVKVGCDISPESSIRSNKKPGRSVALYCQLVGMFFISSKEAMKETFRKGDREIGCALPPALLLGDVQVFFPL